LHLLTCLRTKDEGRILPGRADQEQVDALSKIFSGQSGGFFAAAANFIGENVGIKSSQIEFGNQPCIYGSVRL